MCCLKILWAAVFAELLQKTKFLKLRQITKRYVYWYIDSLNSFHSSVMVNDNFLHFHWKKRSKSVPCPQFGFCHTDLYNGYTLYLLNTVKYIFYSSFQIKHYIKFNPKLTTYSWLWDSQNPLIYWIVASKGYCPLKTLKLQWRRIGSGCCFLNHC